MKNRRVLQECFSLQSFTAKPLRGTVGAATLTMHPSCILSLVPGAHTLRGLGFLCSVRVARQTLALRNSPKHK